MVSGRPGRVTISHLLKHRWTREGPGRSTIPGPGRGRVLPLHSGEITPTRNARPHPNELLRPIDPRFEPRREWQHIVRLS
jgi:hypothetical protein